MKGFLKQFGPGTLVAAAFIGPGTVTVCTLAGSGFGYSLLWAMGISVVATMILQEMASRVGIITQKGLPQVIRENINAQGLRILALMLIIMAIILGNSAYEAGNISGAALGMEAVFGKAEFNYYPLIIGGVAFVLLFIGNYRVLERSLIFLVVLMSLAFLVTALITGPSLKGVLQGLFVPDLNSENVLMVAALVGTTVVPYNLFLHASLVKERWKDESHLKDSRADTVVSIGLGGLVSMGIIIASAALPGGQVDSVLALADSLEPVFGSMARYFFGIGLFAAGVTSAVTAPLAAAYVARSCFGWSCSMSDMRFRGVWFLVLGVGVLCQTFGIQPLELIQFAQVANGILLPLIAAFLFWMVNQSRIMGRHKNSLLQNMLTFIIVLFSLFLGIKSIIKVIEFL